MRGLSGPQADRYAAEVRQAQAINKGQAEQRKSWENRVAQWNDPFSGIGKARRNMETSMAAATTSSNKGMRGAGEKIAAARQAAYEDLSKQHFGMPGGDRDDATRRYASDNALQGTQVQEAGQNQRADLGFRTAQQRAAIEGRRADSEITALGFQTRAAAQQEQLRNQIMQEQDPTKRQSAVQRMRDLSGTQQADPYLVVPGGQQVDEMGKPYNMPSSVFNRQSGQFVQQQKQGGAQPSANHLAALRANPKQADFFDQVYGKGSAARILGGG